MSNYSQQEKANQQQQQRQQAMEQFATGVPSDQEFTFTEERKPINRNLVVLLLIAVVGTSLVYLMYVRGRFNADTQTPELIQANQQIDTLMRDAPQSIQQMEVQLAKTEKAVESFQRNNATGQIPVDKIKINPFAFVETKSDPAEAKPAAVAAPAMLDPRADAHRALDKAKVQMILYSTSGSTVQINNWVYKEGDRIIVDGVPFTVRKITRDVVTLSNSDGDFPLEMQKGL